MYILKYKEQLILNQGDARWVYDLCNELPEWDALKKDYIFKKEPKRIDPREAKELIKKHDLKCVCNNEYGRVYA